MAQESLTAGQAAARRLLQALRGGVSGGRFPHGLLVLCPDNRFAEALCRQTAALWCTGREDAGRLAGAVDYPELGETPPRIDRIRSILEELKKRPFQGGGRCVYIRNAHTMSEIVQDVLLKTLEEPPAGTLFLLSGNENGLLPTIRSRCARFFYPAPTAEERAGLLRQAGASPQEAEQYARWGGISERALRLYQSQDYRALRQEAQGLLRRLLIGELPLENLSAIAKEGEEAATFMLSLARDILLYKQGLPPAENPEQTQEIRRLGDRLTNRQATWLIGALTDCLGRLSTNASAQATFTSLFTQIAEEIA